MKFNLKVVQASLIAAMATASAGSMAAVFPDFQVSESSVPGSWALDSVYCRQNYRQYVEIVTFNPLTASTGTFDTSIKWQAGSICGDGWDSTRCRPAWWHVPATVWVVWPVAGYGNILDQRRWCDHLHVQPGWQPECLDRPQQRHHLYRACHGRWGLDDGQYRRSGLPDCKGALFGGQGTFDPNLSTCTGGGPGINCGSFGTSTSFLLTAAGKVILLLRCPSTTFRSSLAS